MLCFVILYCAMLCYTQRIMWLHFVENDGLVLVQNISSSRPSPLTPVYNNRKQSQKNATSSEWMGEEWDVDKWKWTVE